MRKTTQIKKNGLWEANTKNKESFPAFTKPLKEQFYQVVMTNTMDNTFYASKEELIEHSFKVHEMMLKEDSKYMAEKLIEARNEGFMRLQPILGLVYLSTLKDKTLFKESFEKIISTPNDLIDFINLCRKSEIRSGLGTAVKIAIKRFIKHKLSEYWAIKYTKDIKIAIRLSRPSEKDMKPNELYKPIMNWIFEGDVTSKKIPQILAYEKFKNTGDVKYIDEGRLPHEVVTGIKSSKEVWEHLIKQLPYFALLRNLETLERNKLLDKYEDYVSERLTDEKSVKNSKVLPFRFYTAYKKISSTSSKIKNSLIKAMDLSFSNIPNINGKTLIGLDVSGSMTSGRIAKSDISYAEAGGIFAGALLKKTKDAEVICFDTGIARLNLSGMDSILTNAEKVSHHSGGGTDLDIPLRTMLEKKIKVDNFIGITDSEEWAGSGVINLIREYRRKINPNLKVFFIRLDPYNTNCTPEKEKDVYYIYGWSDLVLKYISLLTGGKND